jgi:hypothetical protein
MFLVLFQQLIDRLIELVRARQHGRREAFDLIVKPLFDDLGPLVAEYAKLIRDVRQAVESGSDLAGDLGYHGADFRITREKLQAMSEAFETNISDHDIREFAARVRSLFGATSSRVPPILSAGFASIGRELTDVAANVKAGIVSRAEALAEVTRIESELHDRWVTLAQRYAELQLRYLDSTV